MINFKANTGTGMNPGMNPGMSGGGFTLGTQNPAGTGFNFGQPQTTTSAPANKGFLTTPVVASASGGFTFGTLTTSTAPGTMTTPTSSGFSLGTTATAAPVIGQTAPTPVASGLGGGFSFGTQAAVPAATTSGFSFGTKPTTGVSTVSGFGLGGGATITPVSSTGTGFSFGGMGATPASTSGFSMGGGLSGAVPAVVGSTSTLPSTGFSFVNTSQPLATRPPGFAAFGMTSTTPQVSVIPVPVASSSGLGGAGMGLGGAQPPSANALGTNSTGAKSDGKSAKEQQMPRDLFATIAVFESWRNAENSSSEENIRQTAAPFHKVGKKAEEIQQLLSELASEYLQLHANAVNLKAEVMKEAEHVEMARRTKDTPMGLQGENKSPEVYFINLVRSFEAEMIYCRNKIDEVSLCMQAVNNPCETPEDIAEVLQREHETLKELASKVYAKHTQLVELSQRLNTKTKANEQEFFRPQSKQDTKTPASSVVRPVLGGSSSGLQAFQEQQQRAKAVTLGAAPPTMPLAQTTIPSLFGSNTGSSIFTGGSSFGNTFNLSNATGSTPFGSKSLFGNTPTGFGNTLGFGTNPPTIQQSSSPFSMNSPFNTKPFGS